MLVFALAHRDRPRTARTGRLPAACRRVVYTDIFRGIPLVLVLFIVGRGLPALESPGSSRTSRSSSTGSSRDHARLHRVRDRGVPGRDRVGASEPAHGGPLARSELHRRRMRFVVLPQAIRRVIPPLLNDFIGLQKDTALISVIGLTEAAAQAGFYATDYFNYAGFTVAAVFFIILTIPLARFTDHIIKAARAARAGPGAVTVDELALRHARERHQALRRARGAARDRPRRRSASGRLPDRRVGLRASRRSSAASTCSSTSTRGRSSSTVRC